MTNTLCLIHFAACVSLALCLKNDSNCNLGSQIIGAVFVSAHQYDSKTPPTCFLKPKNYKNLSRLLSVTCLFL